MHFCSRVQLHLLLQKRRLINSESALFALALPSLIISSLTTGNRLSSQQQTLSLIQRRKKGLKYVPYTCSEVKGKWKPLRWQ